MRGPPTRIMRSSGTRRFASGKAAATRCRRWIPTPGAAGRDDADLLVGAEAQLLAERVAIAELGRVEGGDVAGEVEARLRPVADRRQLRREPLRDDVVGIADEDRAVAQARVAGHVLDHLAVDVGGEERLVLAALGHRQHADEVGEPDVGRGLQLRVLVQEVVDLPGLVGDPDVERLLADEVVEDHEVRAEDLVEATQHLEGVERVLAGLAVDARGLRAPGRRSPDGRCSPHASSIVVTGAWASQWTSRPGTSRRSSRAIATSRQAWPSPIGDEASSARRGRSTGAPPAGACAVRAARSARRTRASAG